MSVDPLLVETARRAKRAKLERSGALLAGQIASFDPATSATTVLFDGDSLPVPVMPYGDVAWQPGNRVQVRIEPEGGAYIAGAAPSAITGVSVPGSGSAAHAATHEPGGSDPLDVDAPAGTGSLRTLGTGATQATAGNDSRLSNARTPSAHAPTHRSGGTDALALNELAVPTALLDLNAQKITNLADAAVTTDAMNRRASDVRYLRVTNNLSEVTAATARTNLGLGTAALVDTGTGGANVPTVTQADARYARRASTATYAARQIKTNGTSGFVNIQGTTWANFDTGIDIVLTAAAGDWIEVWISGLYNNEAVQPCLDVVSVVSGAPVKNWSENAAEDNTHYGSPGWGIPISSIYVSIAGSVMRPLAAGDISGGTVTLRIRRRTGTNAVKNVWAAPLIPFVWGAINHG